MEYYQVAAALTAGVLGAYVLMRRQRGRTVPNLPDDL